MNITKLLWTVCNEIKLLLNLPLKPWLLYKGSSLLYKWPALLHLPLQSLIEPRNPCVLNLFGHYEHRMMFKKVTSRPCAISWLSNGTYRTNKLAHKSLTLSFRWWQAIVRHWLSYFANTSSDATESRHLHRLQCKGWPPRVVCEPLLVAHYQHWPFINSNGRPRGFPISHDFPVGSAMILN